MAITVRTRARQPEQKHARREAILAAAFRLWKLRGFQQLTMNDLAAEAGLAKGTLYLYFVTKEELFLAMLEVRFVAWLRAVHEGLASTATDDLSSIAAIIAETLEQEPDVLPLLLLQHPILEHNVDAKSVIEFRRRILRPMMQVAQRLESKIPRLRGQGLQTLLRVQAYMAGVQQHLSSPAPLLAAFDADPDLSIYRFNRRATLADGVLALLQYAGKPSSTPSIVLSQATEADVHVSKQPLVTTDAPWQRRF